MRNDPLAHKLPPGTDIAMTPRVIMSIPRLGHNAFWGCVQDVFVPLGIRIATIGGPFWHQGMQNLFIHFINSYIKTGEPNCLLVCDYDTVFRKEHFQRLIETFCRYPKIDALAALQPRRACNGDIIPLFSPIPGEPIQAVWDSVVVRGEKPLIEAKTAHFGFTLIRTESLARFAKITGKPWLNSEPDPKTGDYNKRRQDPDIFFWNKWYKQGFNLYVDPMCCVGHIEERVSYFDAERQYRLDPVGVYLGNETWIQPDGKRDEANSDKASSEKGSASRCEQKENSERCDGEPSRPSDGGGTD